MEESPDKSPTPPADTGRVLEIAPAGYFKRWMRLLTYVVFYGLVAGLLVWLFIRFTGSIRLAVLLVAFMIVYMTVMSVLAERNLSGRE